MSDVPGAAAPRPTPEVARRVEELLREQLRERGVSLAALSPQDIAEGMVCTLAPDNSMTYIWRGDPVLHVVPEQKSGPDGDSVLWRMFTQDDMPGTAPSSPTSLSSDNGNTQPS